MFKLLTLFLVLLCDMDERSQRHLDVVPELARLGNLAVLVAGGEDHDVVAWDGVEAAVAVFGICHI